MASTQREPGREAGADRDRDAPLAGFGVEGEQRAGGRARSRSARRRAGPGGGTPRRPAACVPARAGEHDDVGVDRVVVGRAVDRRPWRPSDSATRPSRSVSGSRRTRCSTSGVDASWRASRAPTAPSPIRAAVRPPGISAARDRSARASRPAAGGTPPDPRSRSTAATSPASPIATSARRNIFIAADCTRDRPPRCPAPPTWRASTATVATGPVDAAARRQAFLAPDGASNDVLDAAAHARTTILVASPTARRLPPKPKHGDAVGRRVNRPSTSTPGHPPTPRVAHHPRVAIVARRQASQPSRHGLRGPNAPSGADDSERPTPVRAGLRAQPAAISACVARTPRAERTNRTTDPVGRPASTSRRDSACVARTPRAKRMILGPTDPVRAGLRAHAGPREWG